MDARCEIPQPPASVNVCTILNQVIPITGSPEYSHPALVLIVENHCQLLVLSMDNTWTQNISPHSTLAVKTLSN